MQDTSKLVTQRGLEKTLGICNHTLIQYRKRGIIAPVMTFCKSLLFDPNECAKQLKDRAHSREVYDKACRYLAKVEEYK
jgi:hypothetical protein